MFALLFAKNYIIAKSNIYFVWMGTIFSQECINDILINWRSVLRQPIESRYKYLCWVVAHAQHTKYNASPLCWWMWLTDSYFYFSSQTFIMIKIEKIEYYLMMSLERQLIRCLLRQENLIRVPRSLMQLGFEENLIRQPRI